MLLRFWLTIIVLCVAIVNYGNTKEVTINYYGAYETIGVEENDGNINLNVDPNQFKSQSKINTIANKFCKVNYTISFNGIYYKDCPKVDLKNIAFDSYNNTQETIQQSIDANRDHQAHVDAVRRSNQQNN